MQPICTHTISVQSSKPSHAYPIIRLPREFRELAGSKAEIYQTVHEGSVAFFVKVIDRASEKLITGSNSSKESIKGGAEITSLKHVLRTFPHTYEVRKMSES
ncbi:MAG: hypothetical protein ACXVI1_10190 [Halobacteriota archaeon]